MRDLAQLACGALVASLTAGCVSPARSPTLDVLIVNGTIIDGTGSAARKGDVGVLGDRIAFVGDAATGSIRARRTIDAQGLIVAPGLIDPHTHSDDDLQSDDARRRATLNHLAQGVTTIIVGNDGAGAPDLAERARRFEQLGIGVNVASFIGFGAVRRLVVGDADRQPAPAEVARMRQMIADAMCEGAIGLSTGLYYAPQSYATADEVIALAREAAAQGGVYDTHLRDEGSETVGVLAAIDEALTIGRKAALPVHIAHIKALGVDAHGMAPQIVLRIEQARSSGLRVTADQYPWAASGTDLANALVPRWAHDGGQAAMRQRLAASAPSDRLHAEMTENLRRRGGAESLLLTGGAYAGKTLQAVAHAWGVQPVDAAIRILREGDAAPVASFNMSAADIEHLARRDWVMASSDSSDGHPRKYGSMALRWSQFVRARRLLTPEQLVHRATALPAATFGLADRGRISVGGFADIVVLDPVRYAARADFQRPERLASGVMSVLVNGQPVIANGRWTGDLAGRPIRHAPRAPESCTR